MFRIGLTALVTAVVCFTIAAATGFAAGAAKLYNMKVGDIASFTADNFHCQAVSKTQVACGAKVAPGSVQVYYAPHQLEVIKFGKTLSKGTVLLNVKR
jgi:hypothetical protein